MKCWLDAKHIWKKEKTFVTLNLSKEEKTAIADSFFIN